MNKEEMKKLMSVNAVEKLLTLMSVEMLIDLRERADEYAEELRVDGAEEFDDENRWVIELKQQIDQMIDDKSA